MTTTWIEYKEKVPDYLVIVGNVVSFRMNRENFWNRGVGEIESIYQRYNYTFAAKDKLYYLIQDMKFTGFYKVSVFTNEDEIKFAIEIAEVKHLHIS